MINVIAFAIRYFTYLIRSKHYKGHGVHSPFLYKFTREVIFSNKNNPHFNEIDLIVNELKRNKSLIRITDYGAGSRVFNTSKRRIGDIAKVSSTNKKYGKLLYRIVEYFDIKNILEIGTSLGVGTLYLAYPKKANVYTIEGDLSIYENAKNTFKRSGLSNIYPVNGVFDKILPDLLNKLSNVDLVYFDGNHKMEPTLNYFEQCLPKITNNTIFIFDDIHWSKGMESAWEQVKAHPKTMVTIDLFHMGIVFFRKELSKEHFVIKY